MCKKQRKQCDLKATNWVVAEINIYLLKNIGGNQSGIERQQVKTRKPENTEKY